MQAKTTKSTYTFKELIKPKRKKVPVHYYLGERKERIELCRMRNRNSNLNNNLYLLNLSQTPLCECGDVETVHHYLLRCMNYILQRAEMFRELPETDDIDANLLMSGSPVLSDDDNKTLTLAVLKYIKDTCRFE